MGAAQAAPPPLKAGLGRELHLQGSRGPEFPTNPGSHHPSSIGHRVTQPGQRRGRARPPPPDLLPRPEHEHNLLGGDWLCSICTVCGFQCDTASGLDLPLRIHPSHPGPGRSGDELQAAKLSTAAKVTAVAIRYLPCLLCYLPTCCALLCSVDRYIIPKTMAWDGHSPGSMRRHDPGSRLHRRCFSRLSGCLTNTCTAGQALALVLSLSLVVAGPQHS